MSRNPLVEEALHTYRALDALKLKKGGRLVSTPEGIEIHQPGKPALILTHDNARIWAQEVQEAEQ